MNNIEALALEIGCMVGALPTSYLGLPVGARHKPAVVWDAAEERFRKKLTMWKKQFTSKGKITLINSNIV